MRSHFPTIALASLLVIGCSDGDQQRIADLENQLEEMRVAELERQVEEMRVAALEKQVEAMRVAALERELEDERIAEVELQRTGGGYIVSTKYDTGQKESEGYMLDDKTEVGFWTYWDIFGQKVAEVDNTDMKYVLTDWHKNGQKASEAAYTIVLPADWETSAVGKKSQHQIAIAQIALFEDAISTYYLINSSYPESLEDMTEKDNNGQALMKRIPLDPWKNEYIYEIDSFGIPVFICYGNDGSPGGADMNADIDSRTMHDGKDSDVVPIPFSSELSPSSLIQILRTGNPSNVSHRAVLEWVLIERLSGVNGGVTNMLIEILRAGNPSKASYRTALNVVLLDFGTPNTLTKWHENGQKMYEAGTSKNGKPDGVVTNWHENGQKESEVTFKNGKPDGVVTNWHENGQKMSEGTFKNGELDGVFTKWDENGRKYSEITYKSGKKVE